MGYSLKGRVALVTDYVNGIELFVDGGKAQV
jgi:hypothetical protein